MFAARYFFFVLAFVGLTVGLQPSAAQEKEKEDYKVTLYQNVKFEGKTQVCRQGSPDLGKVDFDNRTSAVKWNVPPDRAAVLFADKNYKRAVCVLVGKGELSDLAKECPNAKDCVTSINFVAIDKKSGYPKGITAGDVKKFGE